MRDLFHHPLQCRHPLSNGLRVREMVLTRVSQGLFLCVHLARVPSPQAVGVAALKEHEVGSVTDKSYR
jgi:hypothetical protein